MFILRRLQHVERIPITCRCARRYVSHRTNVMDELSSRGFVAAVTSARLAEVTSKPRTVYLGVDPSADSLHVGNLLALLVLLHFYIRDHQVIALIGGATGMIGDPGGRSTERNLLSAHVLAANASSITTQVRSFFDRGARYAQKRTLFAVDVGRPPKILNNLDWLGGFGLLDFLRSVGKEARVNAMIARESVKNRLESESGISFTEFTYQLLQAYDFYILRRDHDCIIQLGGSDQWGNIVAGIDLIKRLSPRSDPGEEDMAYGLTIPLLTTPSGEKFGKSAGNAVWLSNEKTSVLDFYQFFLRVADDEAEKYLKLFTLLSKDHIIKVMKSHDAQPEQRIAQRTLANEVTELVHGEDGLQRAQRLTSVLFGADIGELRAADVIQAMEGDPRLVIVDASAVIGVSLTKLCAQLHLSPSRSAASQTLKAGGLYLNNAKVDDPSRSLQASDLLDNRLAILRAGKDNHLLIAVNNPASGV